jgi:Domain of unknown function (DUF4252)
MKTYSGRIIKAVLASFALLACMAGNASAQGAKLQLEFIDRLSEKASETVDVSLDKPLLQVAQKFFRAEKPEEAAIKQLIAGLQGVYVRVLEFDHPSGYTGSDLDPLRGQLKAPGWSKVVGVRSPKLGDNVEVFTWLEGSNITGLAIIAAEPQELVIVNIVGPIDLEKLSQLEGIFGIPDLKIRTGGKKDKE